MFGGLYVTNQLFWRNDVDPFGACLDEEFVGYQYHKISRKGMFYISRSQYYMVHVQPYNGLHKSLSVHAEVKA